MISLKSNLATSMKIKSWVLRPMNFSKFFLDKLQYMQKHDNGKREREEKEKEEEEREGENGEEEKEGKSSAAVALYKF